MRKQLMLLMAMTMLMAFPLQTRADDIPINSTTFPDENFRNWVLAQDYGQDGVLTDVEIAGVTEIDVSEKNISNLKGIEYFTALYTLICWGNLLNSLDVSKNTALVSLICQNNALISLDLSQNTELGSLSCQNNQLSSLDLSKNTELSVLFCQNNLLTSLDLSKNTKMAYLDCNNNQLTSLDISQNTALYRLECYVNQINETEMGNLVENLPVNNGLLYVKWLPNSNEQNVITTTQVAAAKAKGWRVYAMNSDYDWVEYGGDTTIPVNSTTFPDENFRNWVLAQDYGQDGVLKETEVSRVTFINVSEKNIANLKGIEYFTALTRLTCIGNQLTSLDVSQNTALKELYCSDNQLTSLDLSKNTELGVLFCQNNQLTSLDLSKNTALAYLDCNNNQLTSLDISQNTALYRLECYVNQINETEMGNLVENLPANNGQLYVKWLPNSNEQNVITTTQVAAAKAKGWRVYAMNSDYDWVEYGGDTTTGIPVNSTTFPDENFRNWVLAQDYGQDGVLTEDEITGVTEIDVNYKNIASLKGIECFTALMYLDCGINQLTSLDVSKNTVLRRLICAFNQLTSLDVSKNTALRNFSCAANQLTTLDVAQNTALTWLDCQGNQLTSLDISQNTALTELSCSENQLTSLDVSNNLALNSLNCDRNQLTSLDLSQNTALTSLFCPNNQIKGSAMDDLIAGLPSTGGQFYAIIPDNSSEQNVVTKAQVAAAKEKGWTIYYWSCESNDWLEYEGSDPQDITPVDQGEAIDFGNEIDESTNLNGTVVDNVLVNISNDNGGYDPVEGCIVVNTPTDDSAIDGKDIFGDDFKDNYTGIVFKVAPGNGSIKVEAQTTGNMVLKVKIGEGMPITMELEGKLKVTFPYNVTEETNVYVYGGAAAAAPGLANGTAATGELKLYGIEVTHGETGIESLSPTLSHGEGGWYTLDGRQLQGEPSEKGLYIHDGNKIVIK